ncbi:MAG: transcriptional repressor, CopY family [Capsulimonas sp.]|jgi:BlaI family penicillinase repressor|nr:transcriptional repressor, CopY family [Capsulimonas sp.]
MPKMIGQGLSRREREILNALYERNPMSVSEVRAALPEPPTYSAVRSLLRILEDKGHVRHTEDGKRFLYLPTTAPQTAARAALRQVVQTFFSGSLESAVKTFLSDGDTDISDAELDRLSQLIAKARSEEGEAKNV